MVEEVVSADELRVKHRERAKYHREKLRSANKEVRTSLKRERAERNRVLRLQQQHMLANLQKKVALEKIRRDAPVRDGDGSC